MKKIIGLLAILLVAGTSAFAQKITADKVPAAVKQAFQTKFPKATAAKWEMEKKDYEVGFKLNGTEGSANFDATGKWLETETEIKYEALPQAVKATITNKFAGYKAGETNKVETPDKGVLYEVGLSKGTEKIEIQFTKEGEVKSRKVEGKKEKDYFSFLI